jgi:predicted nucleotidyltransferase
MHLPPHAFAMHFPMHYPALPERCAYRHTIAMRLTPAQQQAIKSESRAMFGDDVQVFLFGSRTDDDARGGDVDVMVKSSGTVTQPALKIARLSAKVSRLMGGRKVDVILQSEGLARLPVHDIAERTGIPL